MTVMQKKASAITDAESAKRNANRKNFNLSDAHIQLLEKLPGMCGLKTETQVAEEALVVYAWAVGEVSRGRTIAAIDEKNSTVREITSPGLLNAKAKGEAMRDSAALMAATSKT